MLGSVLEDSGWRQGSILSDDDFNQLFPQFQNSGRIAIVCSQSCDIANNNMSYDPRVEFAIANVISKVDGNLTHGKNPRRLHTTIQELAGGIDLAREVHVDIIACERALIGKDDLQGMTPCQRRRLGLSELKSFVWWLAARYSRPALPTVFNDLIRDADPKGSKMKSAAKKLNASLSGVYVQIHPEAEIDPAAGKYMVNLLGLVAPSFAGDKDQLERELAEVGAVLTDAGMDVKVRVVKESEISVAVFSSYKRFYYDDLSFRDSTALPVEVVAEAGSPSRA